jgi:hypothetical protein
VRKKYSQYTFTGRDGEPEGTAEKCRLINLQQIDGSLVDELMII